MSTTNAMGLAVLGITLLVTILMTISERFLIVQAVDPWNDAVEGYYPYAALLYSDEQFKNESLRDNDTSTVLKEEILVPMFDHFVAVLVSPSWLLTMTGYGHTLPQGEDASKWNFKVAMGTVEVSPMQGLGKNAQVRNVVKVQRLQRMATDNSTAYEITLLRVDEPFNLTGIEIGSIRLLVEDHWPNKKTDLCTALYWEKQEEKLHLVYAHFRVKKSGTCGFSYDPTMTLCAEWFALNWMCIADPNPIALLCQRAVAGFYVRTSSQAPECREVHKKSLGRGVQFITISSLQDFIRNGMCNSDEHVVQKMLDLYLYMRRNGGVMPARLQGGLLLVIATAYFPSITPLAGSRH